MSRCLAIVAGLLAIGAPSAEGSELISRPSGSDTPGDSFSYLSGISGDGALVLFQSDSKNLADDGDTSDFPRNDVFLRDRTAGTTEVISTEPDGDATSGSISADGRRITYVIGQPGALVLLDRRIGERRVLAPRRVLAGGSVSSCAPKLAPDAAAVVYCLRAGAGTELRLMDLATGRSRRIARAPRNAVIAGTSISGDGRTLAWVAEHQTRDVVFRMAVHRYDVRRRRDRVVRRGFSPGGLIDTALSGNGRRLAYTRWVSSRDAFRGSSRLELYDARRRHVQRTRYRGRPLEGALPSFSRDGHTLAFTLFAPPLFQATAVLSTRSGRVRRLPSRGFFGRISANGRELAYSETVDTNDELFAGPVR